MIYPLSDNYYTTYSNNNLFMNSYWLSLFAGSILFSYSCFFYLNMNKVFNNEKIRIFYNSYKKQCKNVMIGSLFCFIILHYLSEMAQFPCSYIVFILTIAYIEIILIFFLCFKYYKSIIFMLLGNWFYYILFKENILPLKQSYNLLSILTNYKLIICFTIFSSLFFLRYEISEKTKYISKTTIVIFLKRMKKYIILVLLGNKKIWKRILDNIVISLSTYVVILSVWGFLNKVGFFLTSSLVNILLYKLY